MTTLGMAQRRRERGGCLGRLVGVAAAAVLVAVPVALALPDPWVARVLAQVYPGGGWELADPQLQSTWRWLLGSAAGLVAALAMLLLGGLTRRAKPSAAKPDALDSRLAKALRRRDQQAIAAIAGQLGVEGGAEAVPGLLAAMQTDLDDETRHAVAAALYRLGRAVTAEVSPRPGRR